MRDAPEDAEDKKREQRHPGPLVPRVVLELVRRHRQIGHVKPEGEHAEQADGHQPMHDDCGCGVFLHARSRKHGGTVAVMHGAKKATIRKRISRTLQQ